MYYFYSNGHKLEFRILEEEKVEPGVTRYTLEFIRYVY